MLKKLVSSLALAVALFTTASLHAAPEEPAKLVEVNLSGPLLSFASKAVIDKECSALLSKIKSVSTRIYDLSDRARSEAITTLAGLRRVKLDSSWTPIASVNEQDNTTVEVMVKQSSNDTINGVSVTVLEPQGKGIVVEIDGELRADQIAAVAQALNLEIPGITQPLAALKKG